MNYWVTENSVNLFQSLDMKLTCVPEWGLQREISSQQMLWCLYNEPALIDHMTPQYKKHLMIYLPIILANWYINISLFWGNGHWDEALEYVHKVTSFGLSRLNLTRVLHKEIHSPAALNTFKKLSTDLNRQHRETGKWSTLQYAHIWPVKTGFIHVNCYKLLHRGPLNKGVPQLSMIFFRPICCPWYHP